MGVASSGAAAGGTMASAQTGVPASVAPQFGGAIQSPPQLSIPSVTVSTTTSTATVVAGSGVTFGANWVTAGVVIAVVLAALSFGVVLTRDRTKSGLTN